MYSNRKALRDRELKKWAEHVSGLSQEKIDELINTPTVKPVPKEVRRFLHMNKWATAKRAICFRAPEDDPDIWRNAVPPDRKPITLVFSGEDLTLGGYRIQASPAADYDHQMEYSYIGKDEKGHHQFINRIKRSHRENEDDVTIGHELVILAKNGTLVALYLGNDGKTPGFPAEAREVRILKPAGKAFTEVLAELIARIETLPDDDDKHKPEMIGYRKAYRASLNGLKDPK